MTRRRFDLTDFEWAIIQPLLPNKVRGVPRVDDRRVINGILWWFRTGSPWADVPERYGCGFRRSPDRVSGNLRTRRGPTWSNCPDFSETAVRDLAESMSTFCEART